jgi:FtsH-binding integral membrane protein
MHQREVARELLIGTLKFLAITNIILAGVTVLLFFLASVFLGGVFRILGTIVILFWIVWDWRGLRQVLRLMRGDLSL